MKTYKPQEVVDTLMGTAVAPMRCCGESGTLATTRPDISTQVRFRKEEQLRAGATALRADGFDGVTKVLTSCPRACRAWRDTRTTRHDRGLHRRRDRSQRAG
jgi:Fe-S oxidoreductase